MSDIIHDRRLGQTSRPDGIPSSDRVIVRHDPQVYSQIVSSPVDLWLVASLVSVGTTRRTG